MTLQHLRNEINQARIRLMELGEQGAGRDEIDAQIDRLEQLQAALRQCRAQQDTEFKQAIAAPVYSPPVSKPRSSTRKQSA